MLPFESEYFIIFHLDEYFGRKFGNIREPLILKGPEVFFLPFDKNPILLGMVALRKYKSF